MCSAAALRAHPPVEAFSEADGVRNLPSRKRPPIVHGARVGSVSQANGRVQAVRDRRA